MGRKRDTEPPWVTAGMSRASWYRHGKPQMAPQRITQSDAAMLYGVSVRSVQRVVRIKRYAPDLYEQFHARTLTMDGAERLLIARLERAEGLDGAAAAAARKRRARQARRYL